MFFQLLLLLISGPNLATAKNCVPPRETINYPHEGQYHRIHPSGDFFLYTAGESAVLVDIKDREKPKIVQSPLKKETYPVESASGGWDLLASPVDGGYNGPNGGMDYFGFGEVLDLNGKAKPLYTDKGHGEWYHSSAELPGSTSDNKKVRTLLYTNRMYRDYEMTFKDGEKSPIVNQSETRFLCSNIFKKAEYPADAVAEYEKSMAELRKLKAKYDKLKIKGAPKDKLEDLENQYNAILVAAEIKLYGPEFKDLNEQWGQLSEQKAELENQLMKNKEIREADTIFQALEKQAGDLDKKISKIPDVSNAYKNLMDAMRAFQANKNPAARQRKMERWQSAYDSWSTITNAARKRFGGDLYERRSEARDKLKTLREKSPIYHQKYYVDEKLEDVMAKASEFREGLQLANPVLSKDGTHVAGLVGMKINVYRIDEDGTCKLQAQTNYRGSKVSFSYPEKGKPLQITFTVEGNPATQFKRVAYAYDLGSKTGKIISGLNDTNPYYPGFLKDGRIMFKMDQGMTIVDPNQLQSSQKDCIERENPRTDSTDDTGMVVKPRSRR